jgi:hypothetical protein
MKGIDRTQLNRPLHGLQQQLDIKELARILGINMAKARTLSHLWGLPFVRIGGALRFDPRTVLEWLDTLDAYNVRLENANDARRCNKAETMAS